ncbi:MAG: polyhydroxyalkanoic acid system family protein [Minisyncoccia bacterium]
MQLKLPHKQPKSKARQRVKDALEQARPQFKDQVEIHEEKWEGDVLTFSFTAQGQKISGTLTVGDAHFDLYVKLPFMLRLFEGRIKAEIEKQIKQMV